MPVLQIRVHRADEEDILRVHPFGSLPIQPLAAARNLFDALPGLVSLFVSFSELVSFKRLP